MHALCVFAFKRTSEDEGSFTALRLDIVNRFAPNFNHISIMNTYMIQCIANSLPIVLLTAYVVDCIVCPFIYGFNQIELQYVNINPAFSLVISYIFGPIYIVISVILSPFVLLFRLISNVCGVLFGAVTTVVHVTIRTIFNYLFTSAHSNTNSWWEFLQDLQPTFILVFLLVYLLLWQIIRSLRKSLNREKYFYKIIADQQKQFDSSDNINKVLDFVLHEASLHIDGQQPLPDVDTTLNLPLNMVGRVTALGGVVEGLADLCRNGPASLRRHRREDGCLVLDVTAGIRKLRVRYSQYAVHAPLEWLPHFYVSGEATATSPIFLRIELHLRTPFELRLDTLEVSKMDLQVDLTGLGGWNIPWYLSRWRVLRRVEKDLKKLVELKVTPIVEDVLQKVNKSASDIPRLRLSLVEKSAAGIQLPEAPSEVLTAGIALLAAAALAFFIRN